MKTAAFKLKDNTGLWNRIERDAIEKALTANDGRLRDAAQVLGWSYEGLRLKAKKYGLWPMKKAE